MASERKDLKRSRALDELEELNQQDRISSIQFNEPELHDFDASSIFEIDESQEAQKSKRKIFGKRANRSANVKVKTNTYETRELIEEEIRIRPRTEVVKQERIEIEPGHEKLEREIEEVAVPIEPVEIMEPEVETIEVEEEEAAPLTQAMEETIEETADDPAFDEEIEAESFGKRFDLAEEEEELEEDGKDDTIRMKQGQFIEEDDDDEEYEYEDEEEEEDDDENEDENEFYDEEEQDLYEDRKHFLLSQYPVIENYLGEQSKDGYNFVRHVGHKYYFVKGDPKPYYYSINYFKDEPSADQWRQWERDGWKLVAKSAAKKKSEAGWFTFRNYQDEGEYKKEIDNEEEKYRFFRKYANSCRSTMFLIFICMACCIVTAFLQYEFQGYLWGIIVCLALFVIALVAFCTYGRMLRHAKKRARLLKARLRIKENQDNRAKENYFDVSESESQLESDWDTLESEKTQRRKFHRSRDEEDED